MPAIDLRAFEEKFMARHAALLARSPKRVETLTAPRPLLTPTQPTVRSMSAPAVIPFPTDRSEAPAVRLALASILATSRPTQLDVARCGVNMRRAVTTLRSLRPREGAPSPVKAIEELQRACEACGGCRGI